MEKICSERKWNFKGSEKVRKASACSIRATVASLIQNLNEDDNRPVIPLGVGDPSVFPSFRTTSVAGDAVVDAVRSAKYNSYGPAVGHLQARRSIADYLAAGQPFEISPDDVYVTAGAKQGIDIIITVLARPGANILLPRPGYSMYEARAIFSQLEIRYFDLLPEQGWEVNLSSLEALADDNTVAMVIINPGNPCGNVYRHEHLKKIAETAGQLGILLIADEAYAHLAFGKNPFVPMRLFGQIMPIVTLGSLSKRWLVPGWALGWMLITDPKGILQEHGVVESIKGYLAITADPASVIQLAAAQIVKETPDEFYMEKINLLRQAVDICYNGFKDVPCIVCPYKAEGAMFLMVKLDFSLLEGINDDWDFCMKLAREESVIVLPGHILGLKNWIRVTFAVEKSSLEEGLERIKSFCSRYSKKQ